MRVDNPFFVVKDHGEVHCCDCPLDRGKDDSLCLKWWYRDSEADVLRCPTESTYIEAIAMSEADDAR